MTRVAAGVLIRSDGFVLLAQRPHGKPYAGFWEFPGGKLESGETPRQALDRELREELGITVRRASPWLAREFVYPHARVELDFFRVFAWDGELASHDGQAFQWQAPGRTTVAPLLPANKPILAAIALPPVYGITCAEDSDEAAFLARAAAAFSGGLRLVQLRDRTWSTERRLRFARALVPLAHGHGARVLWNGGENEARDAACDGVHWTAAALREANSRPHDMLVAASVHSREELARAAGLGVDFAVLGAVKATPTHPFATPLGWDGFARIASGTRVPVFALGGLTVSEIGEAIDRGAHGVALRRGAWNQSFGDSPPAPPSGGSAPTIR